MGGTLLPLVLWIIDDTTVSEPHEISEPASWVEGNCQFGTVHLKNLKPAQAYNLYT